MSGLEAREDLTLLTICFIATSAKTLQHTTKRERKTTYVCSTKSRVLICGGEVDGVVDGTAGHLSKSLLVHGQETCRGALQFAGSAGGDDGVFGASSTLLDRGGNGACSEADAEESALETDV